MLEAAYSKLPCGSMVRKFVAGAAFEPLEIASSGIRRDSPKIVSVAQRALT